MKVTDQVLSKLVRDIGHIDFNQPNAHVVVNEVCEAIGQLILTDMDNTTPREIRFFSLGVAYTVAQNAYKTYSPVSSQKVNNGDNKL